MFPALLVRLTSPVLLVPSLGLKALPLIKILPEAEIVTAPLVCIPPSWIVTAPIVLEIVTKPVPDRLLIALDLTKTSPFDEIVTLPFDTIP